MKYCPYCGAGLDEDMRFCPNCGKPFEGGKENPHAAGKPAEETAVEEGIAPAVMPEKPKKRDGLFVVIAAVVVLAILGGLFASGALGQKEAPELTPEPALPFSDDTDAIETASESVVMLTCYDQNGEPYATGSGFAVFEDGIIVTNYHVIDEDVYRITAETESGASFSCPTVLAYDAEKDIAILKANRQPGLALLTPGDSAALRKGEKVVAIGSPLGLINSVSTGVFSGYIDDKAGKLLQFTAAISHGSSGGALFNDAGEVVGITFASLEEGQSLNLAVPMSDVVALYDSADSAKAQSMEAFYEGNEHDLPGHILTIAEVAQRYKELQWQEITISGYIGFISKELQTAYLIDNLEDQLDYNAKDNPDRNAVFHKAWLEGASVHVSCDGIDIQDLYKGWESGVRYTIRGVLSLEEHSSINFLKMTNCVLVNN